MVRATFSAIGGIALAGLICAGIRWQQSTTVITGDALDFSFLNDLRWDRDQHRFTRTGNDPYGWLTIPPTAFPIRQVEFELSGRNVPVEDPYYFFQSTVYFERLNLGGAIETKVKENGPDFTVSGKLDDSRVLRVDFPDYLSSPVSFRRLVLRSPFASLSSNAFLWTLIAAVAAFLRGTHALTAPLLRRFPWLGWVAAALLVAVKLWITMDVPRTIFAHAMHDDAQFMKQAQSILAGQWLGTFSELTLAKGPVYPLFIAAASALHCPLRIAQCLFHAASCFVFVGALRRFLPSANLRLLLFATLLFDPLTLSGATIGRVLRTGIQSALTLFALAGAVGLVSTATGRMFAFTCWCGFTGLAISAFWFSREEGIWLFPSLLVLFGAAAYSLVAQARAQYSTAKKTPPSQPDQLRRWPRTWRFLTTSVWPRMVLFLLPLALHTGATWYLRLTNREHYGAWVSTDVNDGAFRRAYGALVRITPQQVIAKAPITKETRRRVYGVSAGFAQLQPFLEGNMGDGWATFGWEKSSDPAARKEIRGGWIPWALRSAAAQAGHYQSARTAERFWRRVTAEINGACERGYLAAGPPREGFAPRWDASIVPGIKPAFAAALQVTLRYSDFSIQSPPSVGSVQQIQELEKLLHETAAHAETKLSTQTRWRYLLAHLYASFGYPLAVAGLLGFFFMAGAVIIRGNRLNVIRFSVLVALSGGSLALIAVIMAVHLTSFDALTSIYLAPVTPLALSFCILSIAWAWDRWICRRRHSGEEVTNTDAGRTSSPA